MAGNQLLPMSCGCSGGQSTPPESTPNATSLPSGAGNSYGPDTIIPSSCTPNVCPQPPVNNEVGRDPYCPDWLQKVLSGARGKVLIIKDGCLHFLRSKCTGVLWYDRQTEQVRVRDAPFVSSEPKQATYGFLAKVISRRKNICDDTTEECKQEAVQELAAQVMAQAGFGDIMVAVPPLCGELPQDEAADLDKQIAVHKLNPTPLPCTATGVKFLLRADGTRGTGQNKMQGSAWHWLDRLRLRRSQWGQVQAGSADEAAAFTAAFVPVAGSTPEDPCYELRISAVKPTGGNTGGLPSGAANCDMPVYQNAGTPNAGWQAWPKGMAFFPLAAPIERVFANVYGGNVPVGLDFGIGVNLLPKNCGQVYWVLYVRTDANCITLHNLSILMHVGSNQLIRSMHTNSASNNNAHGDSCGYVLAKVQNLAAPGVVTITTNCSRSHGSNSYTAVVGVMGFMA